MSENIGRADQDRVLCVYHDADLDGQCSAAIVKLAFPSCDLLGMDYGQEFPMGTVVQSYDGVIMVDFSLPAEDMAELHEKLKLVWIDHQKSAIDGSNEAIAGKRAIGIAACELTWEMYSQQKMPEVVRLLGRYDVWAKGEPDWKTRILPFQVGFKFRYPNMDPGLWPGSVSGWNGVLHWSGAEVQRVIDIGDQFLRWQKAHDTGLMRRLAFRIPFDGLKALVINRGPASSRLFESMYDPTIDDLMVSFYFDGRWRVFLYSETIDVSVLAKLQGGGGHKGAAGFVCDELPFELPGGKGK